MKFIHISDLHLGKNIYGVSLLEHKDQEYWVEQFLLKVREISPDAVVMAGDIYDRSSPSGDAVMLFDYLITELASMDIPVLLVAGNHDSGERLSFAKNLLTKNQVYIAGTLEKELPHVTISQNAGEDEITFWLMPYIFPTLVSYVLEDETIRDYDTAARRLLEAQSIDYSKKNVLVAHQNVTCSGKEVERGGSESMVGGVGQIDYTAFDGFTYVALGHIHSSYPVGRPEVRYAGTPLYYHFDELRQSEKGFLLVEVTKDGEVNVTNETIKPLHPMRRIEDTYQNILTELEENPGEGEYLRIVLKNQKITPEISGYLRTLCSKRGSVLMEFLSDYSEFSAVRQGASKKDVEEKTTQELFVDFYKERRNDVDPDDTELEILKEAENIMHHFSNKGSSIPDDNAIEKLLDFVLKQEGK